MRVGKPESKKGDVKIEIEGRQMLESAVGNIGVGEMRMCSAGSQAYWSLSRGVGVVK
jgi:hypothetical protein